MGIENEVDEVGEEVEGVAGDGEGKELSLRDELVSAAKGEAEAKDEKLDAPLEKSERSRDEKGRFAKGAAENSPGGEKQAAPTKTAPQAVGTLGGPPAAQEPPPAGAVEQAKAPQSWKADARELWSQVPPRIQQEVQRREMEIQKALQETAEPRRFFSEFQRVVSPYLGMIQANGHHPLQSIENNLRVAATLQMGAPAVKGKLMADMIEHYGIPLEVINAHLNKEAVPQQYQGQQNLDPNTIIQQAKQQMLQQLQAERQQAMAAQHRAAIDEFAKTHEFLKDVEQTMAILVRSAAEQGKDLGLEEAYNMAITFHPEISQVVKQREAAKAAANARSSTQRAVKAASSIRGGASGGTRPAQSSGSLRDDLRETLEEVASNR